MAVPRCLRNEAFLNIVDSRSNPAALTVKVAVANLCDAQVVHGKVVVTVKQVI
jgi:hypothetical protein